jgi:hypothetical protein
MDLSSGLDFISQENHKEEIGDFISLFLLFFFNKIGENFAGKEKLE